jgi:hypothetical protein
MRTKAEIETIMSKLERLNLVVQDRKVPVWDGRS